MFSPLGISRGQGGECDENSRTSLGPTLREANVAMENGPFEDVFPIENGDMPLLH